MTIRRMLLAGAVIAVTAVAVKALSDPDNRERLRLARSDARSLVDAVREGMAEREGELRAALGLDTGLDTALAPDPARDAAVLDDPAGPRAR